MFAIGIVAHQSRQDIAEKLADTVQADYLSVDDGTLGCDGNHQAVQRHLAALPTTWSVILEDDAAVPAAGFNQQLNQALPLAPTPIISLYLGKLRPPWAMPGVEAAIADAREANADWIIGTHMLHAVGYALKTPLLQALLNYPPTPLPVDQHLSRFARTYGHAISYPFPSLIDHSDTPSVIAAHPDGQPRTPGRIAWHTAPHPAWSTRSVTMRT